MTSLRTIPLALTALLLAPLCAQAAGTPLPKDDRVVEETLPNGLRVLYRQNKKPENRVNVRLMIHVGSLAEEDTDEGLAHFLEHMVFHGGKHFKPGQMDKWLKAIGAPLGGDSNAYTSWNRTTYFLRLKTETKQVRDGLHFFEDLLNPGTFPVAKVNRERGVVLEEMRYRRGLSQRWMEQFANIALPGTAYPKRFPIGKEDDLQKLARGRFVKFQQKWYRPELATAILVGDMPVATMKKLVHETLAKAPKRNGKPPALPLNKTPVYQKAFDALIHDREITKGSVALMWIQPAPILKTIEEYRRATAENLAMNILSERLKERALSKDAPFADPQAEVWGGWFQEFRLNVVAADSRQLGQEKNVLATLTEETDRLLTHGVLQEELDDQRAALTATLTRLLKEADKADTDGVAYNLEDAVREDHPILGEKNLLALWQQFGPSMTVQEIHEAAGRLMSGSHPLTLVELPEDKQALYAKGDFTGVYEKTLAAEPAAKTPKPLVKTVDYSALKPAEVTSKKEVKELDAVQVTFSNGVTAYFKKTDFAQDTILLNGWVDNSFLALPPKAWGLPGFAAGARLVGGTQEFTYSEYERLKKGKNFSISFSADGFGGQSTPADLEESLQWLHDFLTRPAYREETLAPLREELADGVLKARLDQETAFERAVGQQSCPGPMSWYNDDPAYFDAFTTERLAAYNPAAYPTQNMGVSLVGNVDIDKGIALLARYVGSLPATPAPVVSADLRRCRLAPGETRRTVFQGPEDRTMVRLVMNAPDYTDVWDVAAMGVVSTALTLRLKERLREELGAVYYAFASCSVDLRNLGNGRCAVEFTVPWKLVDKALAETRKAMAAMAKNGPTQKELDEVKLARKKNHEEQIRENWFWSELVLEQSTLRKVPVDFWPRHRERIQQVTLKQAKAVAAKYLGPGDLTVVVATGEQHAPGKKKGR